METHFRLDKSIVDIKFSVNNKVYDNDIVVFYKKFAIGHVEFDGTDLKLVPETTIFVEYGQCLREFINFINKSALLKSKKVQDVTKISLSCGKVLLARNTTEKPLIRVSNAQGKDIFILNDKTDIVSCLKLINKTLLFGLWTDLKEHTIVNTFLNLFEECYAKKNIREFFDLNIETQYKLLEKTFEQMQLPSNEISRFQRQVWSKIDDVSVYHMLKYMIDEDKNKQKNPKKQKSTHLALNREGDFRSEKISVINGRRKWFSTAMEIFPAAFENLNRARIYFP